MAHQPQKRIGAFTVNREAIRKFSLEQIDLFGKGALETLRQHRPEPVTGFFFAHALGCEGLDVGADLTLRFFPKGFDVRIEFA